MILKSENTDTFISNGDGLDLDELKDSLLNNICENNKAFIKSQQIDDPEISIQEKYRILNEILLNKPHSQFLSRYRHIILPQHLVYFESKSYEGEEHFLVQHYVAEIKSANENRSQLIKNRRYCCLLKLINDKKYFSPSEMMGREPLLYDQLIGKYQTEAEKKACRRPDAKTDTLVDILFQNIDRDHNTELENKQRTEENDMMDVLTLDDDEDSQDSINSDSTDPEAAEEKRSQWGNFEDKPNTSEQPCTSSSVVKRSKKEIKQRKKLANLITAGERDLLKDEFLGIMHSNFLSGKDKEYFDYSQVDQNSEYDNIEENGQDLEDKYFDDDSQNSAMDQEVNSNDVVKAEESSEDDLDVYMQHIQQHLHKQEREIFQEEFDDD
ncbi:unnamed protein product [Diamesa serratosioi]